MLIPLFSFHVSMTSISMLELNTRLLMSGWVYSKDSTARSLVGIPLFDPRFHFISVRRIMVLAYIFPPLVHCDHSSAVISPLLPRPTVYTDRWCWPWRSRWSLQRPGPRWRWCPRRPPRFWHQWWWSPWQTVVFTISGYVSWATPFWKVSSLGRWCVTKQLSI